MPSVVYSTQREASAEEDDFKRLLMRGFVRSSVRPSVRSRLQFEWMASVAVAVAGCTGIG